MVDGNFDEQYVYEMKQKRGPSLMTCVIQEPKNLEEDFEINDSFKQIATHSSSMQTLNYMGKALGMAFKYLNTHDLISASRVCSTWNAIAMNQLLRRNCRLKNGMVYDWEKFVDCINQQKTDMLDTTHIA
uniref:F-box domain-containing protein n=1 Tax=Schizaphis graminum TaxID=13262 RepID=A0A2S2NP34_SCHGA